MAEPVKVGWAANQAEAEMLQGLLLDCGIPSALRRQLGFDLPDYMAAGGRDLLVAPEAADEARAILAPTPLEVHVGEPEEPSGPGRRPLWVRLTAVLLVAAILVPALVLFARQLVALAG